MLHTETELRPGAQSAQSAQSAPAPQRPIQKLWGGRYAGSTAATLEELNNSLSVDKRLWREDIEASRAWVQALLRADVLTRSEAQQLDRGLLAVHAKLA